jgi:hypothetical protein
MATSGSFKKGEKRPNQGKRGPSKVNAQLKEMILEALDKAGGVDNLLECATEDKTKGAFLSILGKVLPLTLQGPGQDGEILITAIERRVVYPST